jgi:V/A-type H+-transporting ATPase subunit E
MAIEDILKKINDDVREEVASVLSLARAEADSIREKARREAEELRAELMQKAKERAQDHAERVKVLAGLDRRKDILKEKKRLITEAFEGAKENIIKLPPNEYIAFLKPLILQAVESGNEEIIPPSAQRSLFTPELVKNLNEALGREKGRLRLSPDSGKFTGGFILREGNREINLTLDSLIDSQRDALEPQVARILFGENRQHG